MATKKVVVKKKKKFINMEITRVKMNPEQAVLSCCNSMGRAAAAGPDQCYDGNGCGAGGGAVGPSS